MSHIPVLLKESLEYLAPKKNENFIDATVGLGGHTIEILKLTAPDGKVLGIDLNEGLLESLSLKIKELGLQNRVTLAVGNFKNIDEIANQNNFKNISGVLMDLGLNSELLENSGLGFSFLKDEPLDMRFGFGELTAADIINNYSEAELADILWNYGEERFGRKIAKAIVSVRKIKKITNTKELVKVIQRCTPSFYNKNKIHPATRTFQALRIATNGELNNLKQAIPKIISLLGLDARLVIISFHSLEDRIVKNAFRDYGREGKLRLLTKKPIVPTPEEIMANPRARSAKLRAAIKI